MKAIIHAEDWGSALFVEHYATRPDATEVIRLRLVGDGDKIAETTFDLSYLLHELEQLQQTINSSKVGRS